MYAFSKLIGVLPASRSLSAKMHNVTCPFPTCRCKVGQVIWSVGYQVSFKLMNKFSRLIKTGCYSTSAENNSMS